ncbi:MAG: Trk system potassium transporter TrkA [Bacteroidota bacterium]
MRIVIAGAGDVGFHLAKLLSYENKDIVLIDNNKDILKYASTHLDILPVEGDSSSIDTLKMAEVESASLFIAVTTSQNTNLVTSIIAKKLGARRCIARVRNSEYLEEESQRMFKELGIDELIAPRRLAALEIHRLIKQCTFTDVFDFEDGQMSLLGVTLNSRSNLINHRIGSIYENQPKQLHRPMAILRSHKTIIPNASTRLMKGDHIYFVSPKEHIDDLENMIGKEKATVKNVMIIGGNGVALETASLLEDHYNLTLVEADKERCKVLAEKLDNTLVIHGDPSNTELLKEERLQDMDAFLALSLNTEANIIACLTAKNLGVRRTIAKVENKAYIHISQEIGVDTLINTKLIAANSIFRYIRKGKVECVTSLNGVDAEVIEYVVHRKSQLTRKPIKDVHFPDTARIGGVLRNNTSYIPTDEFQLEKEDRVIVLAMPEAIPKLEKLFR